MSELLVKICGITRRVDAELAVELGASALGFIMWPGSPRHVDADAVRTIASGVPASVLKIGVFVDADAETIMRTVDRAGFTGVQLHGNEPAGIRASLPVPTVIKAIAVDNVSVEDLDRLDPDVLILIDAHDPVARGGTGKVVNWDAARAVAATRKTILAGGLNPANVKLAVSTVRPYGVDVSSGVESTPGIKDPGRLRGFFEALHE